MDDLSTLLGKQLVTIGPVGVVVLVGWWIWLRSPRGRRNGPVAPVPPPVSVDQATAWHIENRDAIRDTNARSVHTEITLLELLKVQREMAVALKEIAQSQERTTAQQQRVADTLQTLVVRQAVTIRKGRR